MMRAKLHADAQAKGNDARYTLNNLVEKVHNQLAQLQSLLKRTDRKGQDASAEARRDPIPPRLPLSSTRAR